MRHPFAGIIGPEDRQVEPEASNPSRRGLFGLAAGAVAAGTVGLLAMSGTAEAQRFTTLAIGEEGGRRPGRPTTRAIGEEGGRRPRRGWKK